MLGALLLVRDERPREALVLLGRRAARPSAGDGSHRDFPAFHPDQHFGGAAHDRELVETEVEEVGSRVGGEQAEVQQERIDPARRLLTPRQYSLEGVPRGDVVENTAHVALERVARIARDGGDRGDAVRDRERRERVRRPQAGDPLVEAALGRVVQPQALAARCPARHFDVRDHRAPPTSDSSRNPKGGRATLANAASGVSASSTTSRVSGTTTPPRSLRARNSARRSGMPCRGPEPRPAGYTRGMRTTRAPSVAVAWTWAVVLLGAPAALPAQAWNDAAALALARRAIERRSRAAADTALRDYKAQAHGFLFFLGQFGEGLTEPPRLIKADQLELEVYWKAPGLSKQRIIGWRDRAEIPTDINYHRDHLGIVQNNFGRAIRLGEGDEVRDVPHPLAPGGTELYDFALGDTTAIVLAERAVRVVALRVRPKHFDQPAIVGTLVVDVASADLVRMAFNFTPKAYLDPQLEDVSIVLDNALWQGRFWLPYRQEIEIRRRATWLDIPARGIIRGRWEIDGYLFNLGLAEGWFRGDEITALPKVQRDSFPWRGPLSDAIQNVAEPVRENDLQQVRAEVSRIAGRRALTGLKRRRLGARAPSELVHVNRT